MTDTSSPYLTERQLAERYGIMAGTVANWRRISRKGKRIGPPWYEMPRLAIPAGEPRIRYRLADVLAFEEANNITPLN